MDQVGIPFWLMRGGTSRGPYLRRQDLPENHDQLARILVAIVGSGHALNIDGIGGGTAVTTKVAMLSQTDDDWADIDYFFAQVSVDDQTVDFKPTCGNILVGVGPAAIEMGMIPIQGDVTDVRIRAVNTGAKVLARIQTPDGAVAYAGATKIDGVRGTAAPVDLQFMDTVGGSTGALFPTGNRKDIVDGMEVSCMDVAMPMVMARAESFGVTGYETADELHANRELMRRMETVRIAAGKIMGMGDVSKSVTPKFGLLAPAREGGAAAVRYFMPWNCHPTLAVTGSQCITACLLSPGTVGEDFQVPNNTGTATLALEHPMGKLYVTMIYERQGNDIRIQSAGLTRTARKLASGDVFVPKSLMQGV